ncbi:MAG: hypothetical protein LVR00_00320 [Rhabdochlamydiaceae bacterium]|jgi:adenylosuccinate synthase
MDLNKVVNPAEYSHISLAETAKAKLDDEENSIGTTGAGVGAVAAADNDAYYIKQEEIMMDEQFQQQRDEQRRDDQNVQLNNWQLQNASFKA